MNGQTRARLSAVRGFVALLLTGMSAWIIMAIIQAGVEQAIDIAETPKLATVKPSSDALGEAFHNDARQARLHTQRMVAADLKRTLSLKPAVIVAKAERSAEADRG